jgi:arylsulfatase A-like enzyme
MGAVGSRQNAPCVGGYGGAMIWRDQFAAFLDAVGGSRRVPHHGRLARPFGGLHKPAATVATLTIVASTAGGLTPAAKAATPTRRPNIIVIQADDQNRSDLSETVMPRTSSFLADHGTTFSSYVVATPACCPSRASLITGQYPHNDGVFANTPGYPGLVDKRSTLPAWLENAGYFTVHVGKFLNEYAQWAGTIARPAPGWDRWYSVGGANSPYYDYQLGVNGHLAHYGTRPRSYLTRVLERRAVRAIAARAAGRRPLYLQLDERAPHIATGGFHPPDVCGHSERPIPDPLDARRFDRATLPTPPSFNEADVSDKPSFIQALPPLGPVEESRITARYRCRLATVRGVDRTVGRIRAALRAVHALRDTVLIYISDNGVFDGEHRIVSGKIAPYEEAVRQPLLIRVPHRYLGGGRRTRIKTEVANIDLAPTILAFAHATPCAKAVGCRIMDGRSLLPLLRGNAPQWTRGRAILTEYRSDGATNGVCAYAGLQLRKAAYVHYTSLAASGRTGKCSSVDERELYDLHADPFELRNLLPAPTGSPAARKRVRLDERLSELAVCAGIRLRDPRPPSGHYCD